MKAALLDERDRLQDKVVWASTEKEKARYQKRLTDLNLLDQPNPFGIEPYCAGILVLAKSMKKKNEQADAMEARSKKKIAKLLSEISELKNRIKDYERKLVFFFLLRMRFLDGICN